jgi:4-carboxymuconolactone decarboxylase
MPSPDLRLDEAGLRLRRAVLGDEWVDSSLGAADEFTGPLQEITTNNVWGSSWGRPGLSLASRSLVTIAVLVALNRPAELALHIAGAFRNGCSREEIREALIQCSAYCGMPAAVDAFAVARRVLAETGAGDVEEQK